MFLDHKTLVLNKVWQPIHISSVRDAIILLVKGTAKAVCTSTFETYYFDEWVNTSSNGKFLRTVKLRIPIPEVVVLIDYDKMPTINNFSKRNIFRRDKNICQYCGKHVSRPTVDHVIPRSKGGDSCWENMVTACEACNKVKADKLLDEAGLTLLNQPGKPTFNMAQTIRLRSKGHPSWSKFF